MAEDVLRLVANPTNRRIIEALIPEPGHPRQLARALDLNETEVSRRLKRLERARIVHGQWERTRANVRRYRLSTDTIRIVFAPEGLRVAVDDGADAASEVIPAWAFDVPATPGFVERPQVEGVLTRGPRVVFAQGIAGAGKTFALAHAARAYRDGPVYWHVLRTTDTLRRVVHRAAAFLQAAGHPRLLGLWSEGVRDADALMQALAREVDEARALVILDDHHAVEDPELLDLVHHLLQHCRNARILIGGRERPRFLPPGKDATILELTGFTQTEVAAFLQTKGLPGDDSTARTALARTRGHPLLLNLYAEAALSKGGALPELPQGEKGVVEEAEKFLWDEVFASLGDTDRRILEAASIFRGAFPREALAAALPDETVDYRLFNLERRLLLARRGDVFVLHDLLREFAYARARSKQKRHRHAARWYEGGSGLEARLEAMYHHLKAGEKSRVEHILLKNLDLGDFDYIGEGYHTLYEEILRAFKERDVSPETWTTILDERGDIALTRGDAGGALRFYREEEKRIPPRETAARADVAWKMGIALAATGRRDEALKTLQTGLMMKGLTALSRDRLKRALADVEAGRTPQTPGGGPLRGDTAKSRESAPPA